MNYVPTTWAYRDPITISKLNQMDNNNVWTAERRIFGCQIDVSAANTAFVAQGKMEFGGMWLYRNSAISAIHPSVVGDWEEGVNLLGTSTAFYAVAYNDSGNSFDVKFRNSGPAYSDTNSATAFFPRLYDKTGSVWYRYIGEFHTNTASAIMNGFSYSRASTEAGLGNWDSGQPWTVGVSYQAATDGFVMAFNAGGTTTQILTDAANPPITVRAQANPTAGGDQYSIMSPVKKGDYWKITGAGATLIYWIPLYSTP